MYWLPYSSHTSHHPSQTPCLPWISYATQKLMLESCKMVEKRSSKVSSHPDCIFEIQLLWQSVFSRVYSNCCCSCWFEAEIIKIGQSSHKMYSNNIVNFQESTTILNACTKKSGNLMNAPRSIIVSKFKLQSCYYVHFLSDILGKVINFLIPTSS